MGHFPDPHQHASLQEEALKGAPKGSRFRFRASLASEALPEWMAARSCAAQSLQGPHNSCNY